MDAIDKIVGAVVLFSIGLGIGVGISPSKIDIKAAVHEAESKCFQEEMLRKLDALDLKTYPRLKPQPSE